MQAAGWLATLGGMEVRGAARHLSAGPNPCERKAWAHTVIQTGNPVSRREQTQAGHQPRKITTTVGPAGLRALGNSAHFEAKLRQDHYVDLTRELHSRLLPRTCTGIPTSSIVRAFKGTT